MKRILPKEDPIIEELHELGLSIRCAHSFKKCKERRVGRLQTVFSCGKGKRFRLGSGSEEDDFRPFLIDPECFDWETVQDIAIGDGHALALTKSGRVFSWGEGMDGQLGHGDREVRRFPTLIDCPALLKKEDPVIGISCGKIFSVAWTHSGLLYGWGGSVFPVLYSGRLIPGTRLKPVRIPLVPNPEEIDAMDYLHLMENDISDLAFDDQQAVKLLPQASSDMLDANGTGTPRRRKDMPKQASLAVYKAVCGASNVLIQTKGWQVFVIGERIGGIGMSPEETRCIIPKLVDPIKGRSEDGSTLKSGVRIEDIAVSGSHGIVKTTDCDLFGFGSNGDGRLGFGAKDVLVWTPHEIDWNRSVSSSGKPLHIETGHLHTMIHLSDGVICTAGRPLYGRLGRSIELDGGKTFREVQLEEEEEESRREDVDIARKKRDKDRRKIVSIACGDECCFAWDADGYWVFGDNSHGHLGIGDEVAVRKPKYVRCFPTLSDIKNIASCNMATLILVDVSFI